MKPITVKVHNLGALQLVFIGLKLGGAIDWGWEFVLFPFIAWSALAALIACLYVCLQMFVGVLEEASALKRRP